MTFPKALNERLILIPLLVCPAGLSLNLPLASVQVDQIQFSNSDMLLAIAENLSALYSYREYGVRSRRHVIHLCRPHRPAFSPCREYLLQIRRAIHYYLLQIPHIDVAIN